MSIPNYEKCVKYALEIKGIAGETFKDTTMRVYERHAANPGTVFKTLRKGGIVVPIVKASLFGEHEVDVTATVIVKVDEITDVVDLYVPMSNSIQPCPIVDFVEAWKAAGGISTTAFPADMNTYRPKLIDLKHVDLSTDFDELREAIAENAHDRWALERQSEGWTYGLTRDDQKLETPDMVPYSQLPESERQYDRVMAEDTLKLLIALGYNIEKKVE